MKRICQDFIIIAVVISLLAGFVTVASPVLAYGGQSAEDDFDHLIVKFRAGTNMDDIAHLNNTIGSRVLSIVDRIGANVVAVPRNQRSFKLQSYLDSAIVEYAEVDGVAEATYIPSDPYFTEVDQWAMYKVKADQAWDLTKGSPSVRIAILDTGIDVNHPDLSGKVVASVNFTNSPSPYNNGNDHGTHIAGIAAAATNNGVGIAGLGYNSSLMNVKVLGDDGRGFYSWIAQGIIWAADNGANIINLSLGGTISSTTLQDAIDYAWNKGVVIVAAAGNDSSTAATYPAYYPDCIAVGSTDINDSLCLWSNHGSWVDVAAPGQAFSTLPNGQYGSKSGTSMSSAFVSGLAGLLFSLCKDNHQVRSFIELGCDYLSVDTANGRINALHSVQNAMPQLTGQISGTVTDANTAQPISSAIVNTSTSQAASDLSGQYCMSQVAPGVYTVTASANDYETSSTVVTVTAGQTSITDFKLSRLNHPASTNEASATPLPPPPAAPTLKLPTNGSTVSSLTPRLEWNASTGAASYGVQVSTNSIFTSLRENQTGITNTYYEVPSGVLNWNTTYYWRVNAESSLGISSWSAYWYFRTAAGPPPNAPTNLTATAISSSRIDLSWQDNSDNESGFKVERKTGAGGTYTQIATVGANVTSYGSTGLLANATYYYRVRAFSAAGNSGYSNEASATTLPPPPAAPTLKLPNQWQNWTGRLWLDR